MTFIRAACLLTVAFLISVCSGALSANQGACETLAFFSPHNSEDKARISVSGWHCYWKDGLRIDSPQKNLTFKGNLSIFVDGGFIGVDETLDHDFANLDGSELTFRRLRLSAFGTIYEWMQIKIDIDWANVQDIKDDWFRFTKLPMVGHLTVGHMKEPFSFEESTSGASRTFMEKALPVDAFSPGRNIGISRYTPFLNQRATWGAGAFLNTGSFANAGQANDRIDEANGFGITGRITGLPWYEDDGKQLLHLGLSYRHDFRDADDTGFPLRIRARPESALTDQRLIDTGPIYASGVDLFNTELAVVHGPFSLQGEYFHSFADANTQGDPSFWGYYLQCSLFLTGEHRTYNTRSGVFSRLQPNHPFRPGKDVCGAWEIGVRFSYADLNDKIIKGGKEHNLTAGLNWYLDTNIRFVFNYVRAVVEDRERQPAVQDGRADIFQGRFQIDF